MTHQQGTSVAAYALKWKSRKSEDIWKAAGKAGVIVGANIAVTYMTGGAMTLLRSVLLGANGVNVFHDLFDSSKKMAKLTG